MATKTTKKTSKKKSKKAKTVKPVKTKSLLKQQRPLELDRLLTELRLKQAGLSGLEASTPNDPELALLESAIRTRNPAPKTGTPKISPGTLRRLAR